MTTQEHFKAFNLDLAKAIIEDAEPMEVGSIGDPSEEIFYQPIPNYLKD